MSKSEQESEITTPKVAMGVAIVFLLVFVFISISTFF